MMVAAPSASRFVVSLDFELYWGVRDNCSLDAYRPNLVGVDQVIPRLLELFSRYKVAATFATVGLLFFGDATAALGAAPKLRPTYVEGDFSPYRDLQDLAGCGLSGTEFFAPDLIRQIQAYKEHEIATHTFCHYYCMETGQNLAQFQEDLKAAIRTAQEWGINLQSIVLPRVQNLEPYLKCCQELGIAFYRGTERTWLHTPRSGRNLPWLVRILRVLDSYLNGTGLHCYSEPEMLEGERVNIPSSYLLRPYSRTLRPLEFLKFNRISTAMTHAAQNGLLYHIWWHPHNFGVNQDENFRFLERILRHFASLRQVYGMRSCTMAAVGREVLEWKKEG